MPNFLFAKSIVQKLVDAGYIAYFAGGWVRDYIMQHPSDDIDIATSAPVDVIQKLFPKTIPVGIAFGIVIVVEGGHSFEVATFRKDLSYEDGRRPSLIDKADPQEDAHRRDFTINGLFFDPLKEEIIDFIGGREDIQKKLLRAIGNPHERFREDRLRMMRAVRYATRFSFKIDEETLEAIKAHAPEILPAVAIERIWQEFRKMSRFAHFDKGLVLLHELGLLAKIFPSLKELSNAEIRKRVHYISKFPKNTPTVAELLELFPELSKEGIDPFCEYLKLSNEEKKFAYFLKHTEALILMPQEWQDNLELIEWANTYANTNEELVLKILSIKAEDPAAFLKAHEKRKERLNEGIRRLKEKDPLISSKDLSAEGIPSGIQMGKLLKEAERLSINLSLYDKKEVMAKLKKNPLWKG